MQRTEKAYWQCGNARTEEEYLHGLRLAYQIILAIPLPTCATMGETQSPLNEAHDTSTDLSPGIIAGASARLEP